MFHRVKNNFFDFCALSGQVFFFVYQRLAAVFPGGKRDAVDENKTCVVGSFHIFSMYKVKYEDYAVCDKS